MTHRARRRHRRGRRRSKVVIGMVAIITVVLIALIAAGSWVISIANQAPSLGQLRAIDQGESSVIYAADGSRLGYVPSDLARTPIALSRVPINLQNATVAIEDQRFYQHNGIDVNGIFRAAVKDIEAGKPQQGGSTITQQLVRNLYISEPKRDIERKIVEAKLALELEKAHSKRWILGQYLNTVSYGTVVGRTAVGTQAAAKTYFDAPASRLDLAQSALLAGIPQSPSRYNPLRNPASALARRNEVLQKMARLHYISPALAARTSRRPLELHRSDIYTKLREPYFFEYVKDALIQTYGVQTVRRGGLSVYTTVDPGLQQAGRAAIDGVLNQSGDPAAAVVSIDPSTGFIRAMASSDAYSAQQFNLAAQGHRQPGSAFKVFVLTTAIKNGVDPRNTFYVSKPLHLNIGGSPWNVSTYSHTYGGRMSLVKATLESDNTVYAQLDLDLGPGAIKDTANSMGITTQLDAIPAEGLGGLRIGVSPLEMADAYATLASGGVRHTPIAIRQVVFPGGRVDRPQQIDATRVLSPAVAYQVTKILHQNVLQGTGTAANTGCAGQAGKTGTTDNFTDGWFVGYQPNLSTASWVGFPNASQPMRSVHGISVAGGTFPAQIWHDYYSKAGIPCVDFTRPSQPIEWSAFYGSHSVSGSGGGAGGGSGFHIARVPSHGNTNGYNPNFYAPGAGQGPAPSPPPPKIPSFGGGHGGKGGH